MKVFVFLLPIALCLTRFSASAQDCSTGFYPIKEGTHFQMTFYDEKGKANNVSDQTIKTSTTTATGVTLTISQNMTNSKGKTFLENSTSTVTCENGVIQMNISDMSMGDVFSKFKGMEVTVKGDGVKIPSSMEVGQQLSDGATEFKVGMSGMTIMTMSFNMTNRKVEAKESKTTPAGTFDCYKISYDMEMKGMGKRSFHVVQWMAKGVGMVRSENYKDNQLNGYIELTKFEK